MGKLTICKFVIYCMSSPPCLSYSFPSSRVALVLNIFFVVLSYMTEPAITPCTIGIPHFVILSNMSSYVYRNMRLGFYRDYSVTTSAINRALQGPGKCDQQHHGMVFSNPLASPKHSEVGRAEGEVEEHAKEVTGSNSKREGEQTGNMEV